MPPKDAKKVAAAAPPPEEVRLTLDPAILAAFTLSQIKSRAGQTHDSHIFCSAIVDDIYKKAEVAMIEQYISATAIPVTVHEISSQLLDAMHLVFITRDDGDDDATCHGFGMLHEPIMIPTDTHCRGVIPTRITLKFNAAANNTNGKPPSAGSEKVKSTPNNSRPGTRGNNGEMAPASISSEMNVLTASPSLVSNVSHKQTPKKNIAANIADVPVPATTENIVMKETEEDEMLRANLEAMMRRQADIQHESNKLQAELASFEKGKDFTIDGATVIPVTPVDMSKVPQRRVDVRSTLPEEKQIQQSLLVEQSSPARGSSKPGGKPAKTKKPDWNLFTSLEVPVPPMVSGVAPSPGVASKEGDVAKRTELKNTRMTRVEYRKNAEVQNMARPTRNDGGEEEEKGEDLSILDLESTLPPSSPAAAIVMKGTTTPSSQGGRVRELQKQNIAKIPLMVHKEQIHEMPHKERTFVSSPSKSKLTAKSLRKLLPAPVYPAVVGHGHVNPQSDGQRTPTATSSRRESSPYFMPPSKVKVRGDLMDDVSKDFLTKYTSVDQ